MCIFFFLEAKSKKCMCLWICHEYGSWTSVQLPPEVTLPSYWLSHHTHCYTSPWTTFPMFHCTDCTRLQPITHTHYITPTQILFWSSLEEKKALPNCGNKDGNIIHVLQSCISTSVATVLKRMKWRYPYAQVIGVWWWVFGSFKVTPEVFSCFLQTSQVLPHWLNHHFSLILVLYTETLSC